MFMTYMELHANEKFRINKNQRLDRWVIKKYKWLWVYIEYLNINKLFLEMDISLLLTLLRLISKRYEFKHQAHNCASITTSMI